MAPEKEGLVLEPNPEHLTAARLGTAGIAEWTAHNPGQRIKLTRADLRQAELAGVELPEANLFEACLQQADLGSANLKGAFLMGADLKGADLSGADLKGASLHRADLSGTRLSGARGLNLTGAAGYLLDGEDISDWVIPPAPIVAPTPTGVRRWNLFARLRARPYSDPWSTIRRAYTGIMTAFHLLLAITALGPYALRAVFAATTIREHGMPRIAVALGCGRDAWWFLVPSGVILVGYNMLRIFATWRLSQLREEEVRSRHAPQKDQYWLWWLVHQRFMRWAGAFAIALGAVRSGWWLLERV